MANLHPLEFDADSKLNVAAAVGNYKNKTATALGLFYRPNEDVMFNVSGTVGSSDNMVGGGVAIRIGHGGNKARNKQMAENAAYVKGLESRVDKLQQQMDALNQKIAVLRHAVNVFNTTTVLEGFGFTIDEALVRMAMLTKKKQRLAQMKQVPSLVRTSPGYGSNTPEMTCRNYDAEQVEQEYRRVSDQLTALQLTLDRANLLLEFEVELEG